MISVTTCFYLKTTNYYNDFIFGETRENELLIIFFY